MAEFQQGVLTTKGLALLAKAQAGTATITFTKFQIGNGTWSDTSTDTLMAATSLVNAKGEFDITKCEYINDATTQLTLVASNESNTSAGYYITEVGVFATDGSTEVLYAIYLATEADWFPAYNSITPSSITYTCPISVANASEVTVNANSAGIATQDDLEALQDEVAELQAYVGYTDDDIYGIEVDYANKTFTRLAGAADLDGGEDFDGINAFGGRKRCCLTDDGVVVAYYGDDAYTETGALTEDVTVDDVTYEAGTAVQVMVEQPKFYYKVVPLDLEKLGDDLGYSAHKIRYYVSDEPKAGFKVHPAFVEDGNENDYIYLSAYEGSLYDSDEAAYITDDSQVMDTTADLLCSIAGVKPASGFSQNLYRSAVRALAQNRGAGWEQAYAATISASQLLMVIEYGTMNLQTALGYGVTSITDDSTNNCSSYTGATSELGNASGIASETVNEIDGTETTYTADKYVSVSYRGEENFWGNIWYWVDGINRYADSDFTETSAYSRIYVADHDFADGTGDDPYEDTGLDVPYTTGSYISAMGYSEDFDWLFMPSEIGGTSSLPVGDKLYNNYTGWRVALLGGGWYGGVDAGPFCWVLYYSASYRYRYAGGRAVFIPSKAA